MSTLAHGESTRAVENDQHTSTNVDDVPEPPQHSPQPSEPPDRTAKQQDEPPGVELEGKMRSRASCDDGPTSDVTDASRASEGVEDDGNRPKKLRKTLERVSKRSEPKEREDSRGRLGDEPDEPGGETGVPGDCQTSQKRPRNVSNERVDEANTSHRDRGPGSDPGDRERQSDGDVDEMDGRRGGKDGATSGTRRDSNESKRDRWLKPRRVSTDGVNAKRRTYLGSPHHSPIITCGLPTTRTHRVVVDDSRRSLGESGLSTRAPGHAVAPRPSLDPPPVYIGDAMAVGAAPPAPLTNARCAYRPSTVTASTSNIIKN